MVEEEFTDPPIDEERSHVQDHPNHPRYSAGGARRCVRRRWWIQQQHVESNAGHGDRHDHGVRQHLPRRQALHNFERRCSQERPDGH